MNLSGHLQKVDFDRRFRGIAARAGATDLSGEMPKGNWQDVVDSGYLRLFHSKDIGGSAADGVTQVTAMECLAKACPSTYWTATMSTLVCGKLLSTHGDPGLHQGLMDGLFSGQLIGCLAVSERGSGGDATTFGTSVRPSKTGYLITGWKDRVINASHADLAVVLARQDQGGDDSDRGWCIAFVDLRQDAVRRYATPGIGLRGASWGGLVFEDAHVPPGGVIPVVYEDYLDGTTWSWLLSSVCSIAIAESALTDSVAHAAEHVFEGRPTSGKESIQAMLAGMRCEIDAARHVAWRAGWLQLHGQPDNRLLAMLKVYAGEMAVRATERAVHIHGSWGLIRGHPVERLGRDARMNLMGGLPPHRLRELVAQGMGMGAL